MNVLLLTPDRVGSTLLQRVLTVYLLGQNLDKPVINLHELSNGLIKYYNNIVNAEVLGKPNGTDWGYYQSLDEITDLLKSVEHYKTSRLAHYHLVRRNDNIADQIKFYEYLNNNFYIISCRRENLFEYALSWAIQSHSKKLNVYRINEKIDTFLDIYKNKITVTKEAIFKYLDNYKKYINWSDNYFNVQSYFNYDTDVHNIENYILNLDLMKNYSKRTWKDMFGQEFHEFNACHRMLPNLQLLNNREEATESFSYLNLRLEDNWDKVKGTSWPEKSSDYLSNKENFPLVIQKEIDKFFAVKVNATTDEYNFLRKHIVGYHDTALQLNKLCDDGFLVTPVPIKLQSLKEKRMIIKNFDECIDWYNLWVNENNFGKIVSNEEVLTISNSEENRLNSVTQLQLKNT
jgi:hypothetical protein